MLLENRDASQLRGMMRGLCITLLSLHFYYFCYGSFLEYRFTFTILDRILLNFEKSGLFKHAIITKITGIMFWAFSFLIGNVNAMSKKMSSIKANVFLGVGLLFYLGSCVLVINSTYGLSIANLYIIVSIVGFVMSLTGIRHYTSQLAIVFSRSVFNEENESFPQEERLLTNQYSVNIPATYRLRNQLRASNINVINCFRGTAVWGSAGSGKTLFVFRPFLEQWLAKGFTLFVYDFKYPDLTRIVLHHLKKNQHKYDKPRSFYVIDFDHLGKSHRCNPLDPASMVDLSDAAESSRTILLSLNKEWIGRQGDFFIESAISFITANIWFLRKFEDGKYCTLPHLIELIQSDYSKLFSVLRSFPEIETLIMPFVSLFLSDTMDTLESQAASAKIALASLSSPTIYYVLSGNEFTLDINNPDDPKVVCLGSNPQKQQTYGAIHSLYITRMTKLINRKNQLPCGVGLDEMSTVWFPGLANLLATGRSNKIAVIYGAQSLSLIRSTYGREQADVLFDLPGNLFCGQGNYDTAKAVSESMGKILQPKQSYSYNTRDNTISRSEHLDPAVPPSKITAQSSGEFTGFVADNPNEKIKLKAFHCQVQCDLDAVKKEESEYEELPDTRLITEQIIQDNFNAIKEEVRGIINFQLTKMEANPLLSGKIIVKNEDTKRLRKKP